MSSPASARKTRRPSRSARGTVAAIPLTDASATSERLALRIDELVTQSATAGRKWKALQAEIVGQTVRDAKTRGSPFLNLGKIADRLTWPASLYVPRADGTIGLPRPPADHLYSDQWTGGTGVATADRNTGALFVFAGTKTTDASEYADAGVGIRYAPKPALSYVRYEPEVSCAVTYRLFVDLWPTLVAGDVRARGSLFVGSWLLNPVLGGSFELVQLREVPVFDTGVQNAGSNVWPNVPTQLSRAFSGPALATTFLLQGGRTYLFGVVARARVSHNVTTSQGKPIPHDGTRFKLYSQLACSVPFMSVFEQQVLIP